VDDSIEEIEEAPLVLLMGSVGDRALGAYELYEKGKIEEIFIVESHLAGSDILEEQDISIPGDADLSRQVLIDLGVPEEAITVLSGDAESTKDEALVIRDYFKEHPKVDEIILTTSKFHSYRAKQIFNKALNNLDITVYSSPTEYDPFEADGWFRDREDIQRVVTEYIKLAHYFFLEQFQME
jgi:uncharacterized SAM-binding protein YcdF (DUF218 family)